MSENREIVVVVVAEQFSWCKFMAGTIYIENKQFNG